ncbi:hypothetical protein Tco_0932266 [Tanacetum coccineum]
MDKKRERPLESDSFADRLFIARYLLERKSDDNILLLLLVRIIKALGNYRIFEYEPKKEWTNHRQALKLEFVAIIESMVNFIVSTHSKGKKRLFYEAGGVWLSVLKLIIVTMGTKQPKTSIFTMLSIAV